MALLHLQVIKRKEVDLFLIQSLQQKDTEERWRREDKQRCRKNILQHFESLALQRKAKIMWYHSLCIHIFDCYAAQSHLQNKMCTFT